MKYKSKTFWVSLCSAILLSVQAIGSHFGFSLNEDGIMRIVNSVLGMLVFLGILKSNSNHFETDVVDFDTMEDQNTDNNSDEVVEMKSDDHNTGEVVEMKSDDREKNETNVWEATVELYVQDTESLKTNKRNKTKKQLNHKNDELTH